MKMNAEAYKAWQRERADAMWDCAHLIERVVEAEERLEQLSQMPKPYNEWSARDAGVDVTEVAALFALNAASDRRYRALGRLLQVWGAKR